MYNLCQINCQSLLVPSNIKIIEIIVEMLCQFQLTKIKIVQILFFELIMKKIISIVEEFLRKYPSPSQLSLYDNLLKLNFVYSSPYTDSKQTKQVFYPLNNIEKQSKILQSEVKNIVYNEKGRIQESNSFNSVLTKQKHEKLLQDDVFGKAKHNKANTRWVYIAEIKQETTKSYFNEGKGKLPYKYDFGETYDDIKQVGIFIWDKQQKNVFRVQIDKQLIPSCPSFSNQQGTQLIFHAYERKNFGHGILHCFNRPVSIYQANITFETKQPQKNGEGQKSKKEEKKIKATVKRLITDGQQTNIFPTISPCFNYLVYHSGTGITHTYYLDLVIAKKIEGSWVETHRVKEHFVGYYDTLKNYMIVEDGKTFAISQTIQKSSAQIYKIDVETGQYQNLTEKFTHHDFDLSDVYTTGFMSGTVCTNNFNTFFYIKGKELKIIEPQQRESFIEKQYHQPINSLLLYASEENVLQQYRARVNKRPLVVLPHGGPHGSFYCILTSLRYTLLKMGYALLFPNFSGSIGYGKDYLKGALKNVGQTDAKQIISLLGNVLQDNPMIDKFNVHIQGGSYGGYMTAILGSRYPQYFKSAVILNGVLNIPANLWFTDIPEWNTVQTLARAELSGLTQENYVEMFRQSPTSQPMKIPTLQFLGAKDRRVPYRQGLLFDAITKDFGTPITTYVYENSNHSLADSVETSIDIVVKTILFLQGIKQEEESKDQNKNES